MLQATRATARAHPWPKPRARALFHDARETLVRQRGPPGVVDLRRPGSAWKGLQPRRPGRRFLMLRFEAGEKRRPGRRRPMFLRKLPKGASEFCRT